VGSEYITEEKLMDDAIYSKLEEVGFSISDREFSLSEIIGTPSHIEISYEMELDPKKE